MTVAFAVSAGLVLVPLFLSGYARFRAPADSAGLWLLGVAVLSGWLAAGVREGWWALLIPQFVLVGAATWFWVLRQPQRLPHSEPGP